MEKILALYGQDSAYMSRLNAFLRSRSGIPFQVYSFQDPEKLRQFSKRKDIDILLSSGEESTGKLNGVNAKDWLFLSESELLPEEKRKSAIYKYQSGDSILRELMGHYGDSSDYLSGGLGRNCELYMVFSPIGRCGKTSFALSLACTLGKTREALYITLEESSWLTELMNRGYRGTLTEALYYFKEGTLDAMKLRSLCYESEGLRYIPPVRNPEDVAAIEKKDMAAFLEALKTRSGYDAIIVDTDSVISRFGGLFPAFKKIFIPVREDQAGRKKIASFEAFLRNADYQDVDKRFVKLSPPVPNEKRGALPSLDMLSSPPFSDFADAVIRNYISVQAETGANLKQDKN